MKKLLSFFVPVILTLVFWVSISSFCNVNNSLYVNKSQETVKFFNEVYKNFDKKISLYESKNLLDSLNYNYEIINKDINDEIIINVYMNQNKMCDNIKLFFNKQNNTISNKQNLVRITYTNVTNKQNNTLSISNISSKKTYNILKDGNKDIQIKNIKEQENFLFE